MAILRLEDGSTYTELEKIVGELASLQVSVDGWPIGDSPQTLNLLAKEELTEGEKGQVLQALGSYFERLQQDRGYQTCDLIALNPNTPNLDVLTAKFQCCHTHADDEVRYVIDGEGVFGFVRPDGSQVELTVHPEEYVNVPAGTEHWFRLTDKKRIKAIRYFTTSAGWSPDYTGTAIRF